jgi:hypothetical protein
LICVQDRYNRQLHPKEKTLANLVADKSGDEYAQAPVEEQLRTVGISATAPSAANSLHLKIFEYRELVQKTIDLPLVVDLDGTLTLTDTLVESVILVIKRNPLNLIRLPIWLLKGLPAFKAAIAARSNLAAAHLPYRKALIEYLAEEKHGGRRIILATAAHSSIAKNVAAHLGLFDEVLATEESINLKGLAKLERAREYLGERFVYAGDSHADLPVWLGAQAAILAGVSPRLAASVRAYVPIEREFPNRKAGLSIWLKALRVHQWLKNLLLFVPLLTAFFLLRYWKADYARDGVRGDVAGCFRDIHRERYLGSGK